MAINIRNWLFTDAGAGIQSAAVEAYVTGTTTPSATTSSDANGAWAFSSLTASKTYDVKLTKSGQIRWLKGGAYLQLGELDLQGILNASGAVAFASTLAVTGAVTLSSTLAVTGATTLTGLVKTTGGVHVGGTSDPGADNLLVDGTAEITGAATLSSTLAVTGVVTLSNIVAITATATGYRGVTISNQEADNNTGAQVRLLSSTLGDSILRVNSAQGTQTYGSPYDLLLMNLNATGAVRLGANSTLGFQLTYLGNVVCGSAALATNATAGFFYICGCAGAPTGTPTSHTGRVPMVYDTTNNKLYVYNGAWKNITLA